MGNSLEHTPEDNSLEHTPEEFQSGLLSLFM